MNITNMKHDSPTVLPQPGVTRKGFSSDLAKAGAQFESLLLNDVFSKLRESFSLDEGENSDAGHDTLTGLADQALCAGLAARGGLGLGAMITKAVEGQNR
jgi:Rod binding domain-containing protein